MCFSLHLTMMLSLLCFNPTCTVLSFFFVCSAFTSLSTLSVISRRCQFFFLFQSNYSAISATCNTWRNYKDVQDSWDSVRGIIVYYMNNIGNFSEAAKPGAWNDPDMVASYEPPRGKTNNLHMRKQRRRSASR